jgi:hypothetical protein
MKNTAHAITLIIILLLSCSPFIYGQGINNIFMYGYFDGGRGYMNFSSGFPITYYDTLRQINMNVANANIAGQSGNLLFYTNGVVLCDSTNNVMQNGNALNPSTYTTNWTHYGLRLSQTDLVLPIPNDSNKYYLFHETINNDSAFEVYEIYYSIIDMSLNSGLGSVTQKKVSFFQDTLAVGNLTACKHANGRDWWLIVPEHGHPSYYSFIVSPYGIQYISKQTIGNRFYDGQVSFSPDGTHYGMYDADTDIEIFDFDRCTGNFSNYRYAGINDSMFGIGFSFSPNSKIAYASSAHSLYQVNLDSTDISTSLNIVASWDSTYNPFPPIETGFFFQQLASDGKTYIATTGTTQFMHIINFPDSAGMNCNVLQHALYFGDSVYNWNSVPNHPNYFLGPVVGSVCDSLTGMHEHFDEIINFQIKPNPARDLISISYLLPQNKSGMFEMYDMVGKKIYSLCLPPWSTLQRIETSEMASGVYIGVITSNKRKTEKKIVVIKE